MRRLFFALWPDDALRDALARQAAVLSELDARARRVSPARYHLTLRFVGSFPTVDPALVDSLVQAGDDVRCDAFGLVLDRTGAFARSRVAWSGCRTCPPGLAQLQQALDRAVVVRTGLQADTGFVPHVTLLRGVCAPLPEIRVAPLSWQVREFALCESGPAPG